MSLPTYNAIPPHNDSADSVYYVKGQPLVSEKPSRCRHKKFFRLLAASALAVTLFYGLQQVSRGGFSELFGGFCSKKHAALLPSHYTLPSGDKIPSVALGVWQAAPGEVGNAVQTALKAGYRHIDGAWIYGNEAEVGEGLRLSNVPRSEVWLTSKLWNTFHAPKDIEPSLDESLSHLGTDYVDLYLIHWPVAQYEDGTLNEALTTDPYPTWQKLEELVEKGKIRNIGVSNFNVRRLQNLTANPLKIRPAVNQVELSYWNPQPELVKWSKEHDLLLEAYSPLGSTGRVKDSLDVPEVKEVAAELGITPAQVLISWQVQRGNIVLPKSVTPHRIVENLHISRIPEQLLNKLEKAAASHPPERSVDPSKRWGLDIFE